MRGAVFLDRDGVLNAAIVREGKPYPPASADEVVILPGVVAAIEEFHRAELVCVVVSNQPDVARGALSVEHLHSINSRVAAATGVDIVTTCIHDDADECVCRKPRPGLILNAAAEHALDLERSVMVGDRWRDIAAGHSAGLPTVFIDRGYREQRPTCATLVVSDLADAVPWILTATSKGRTQ